MQSKGSLARLQDSVLSKSNPVYSSTLHFSEMYINIIACHSD
jgi:hypothetical protein